mmetsp:Transcript_14657/g.26382  ORF Transcript_14657/g.26382 Transcript_14657/m.26382 type:complete len:207 (+) Transcript_14657:339-959(+)
MSASHGERPTVLGVARRLFFLRLCPDEFVLAACGLLGPSVAARLRLFALAVLPFTFFSLSRSTLVISLSFFLLSLSCFAFSFALFLLVSDLSLRLFIVSISIFFLQSCISLFLFLSYLSLELSALSSSFRASRARAAVSFTFFLAACFLRLVAASFSSMFFTASSPCSNPICTDLHKDCKSTRDTSMSPKHSHMRWYDVGWSSNIA